MKLYIYIDESGTFDKNFEPYFVYGGVIVPGTDTKTLLERQYLSIENNLRMVKYHPLEDAELKAHVLDFRDRKRLFKAIRNSGCIQFGAICNQTQLHDNVFLTKGKKQRYLDWFLKIALKRALESSFASGALTKSEVTKISIYVDEHTSSTEGKYNLEETIDQEFRTGVYQPEFNRYIPPVFSPDFPEIHVSYLDSRYVTLIRAADITENWIYCAQRDELIYPSEISSLRKNIYIFSHPSKPV